MPGFGHSVLDAHMEHLLHVWRMEESSGTRVDSVGSMDLSDPATAAQGTGKAGNCVDLERGGSDRLYNAAGLTGGKTIVSLSCWIKLESTGLAQAIAWEDTGVDGYSRYLITVTDSDTLKIYMRDSATGAYADAESVDTFSSGAWYHLLVVVDTVTDRIYAWVNGSEWINSSESMGAFHDASPMRGFQVGARYSSGSPVDHFDGLIDEIYVWDSALGLAEAGLLYNGGDGIFWMPYGAIARGVFSVLNGFEAVTRGGWAISGPYTARGRGRFAVTSAYTAEGRGKWAVCSSYTASGRGAFSILLACLATGRGRYRTMNDALTGYELYRGIDAEPDFDSAPWETFTSLPHETAALDVAPAGTERTYYFVLRARNKYGLASENVLSWTVTVDDAGAQVTTRPSAPAWYSVEPAAGGTALVTAEYFYTPDGAYAATKWLVYLTSDGSDPDPDLDTPTEVSMIKSDGVARLSWTSGALGDGATVKVIVRTRRVDAGPVNVDSDNTDIESTTADTDGPAAPSPAGIFFGSLYEQGQ